MARRPMVTQAPRRSAVAFALAFTLSCIGLIVLVWIQFGGEVPFAAQGYRVHVTFRESGLLVPNADVRISGVNVGKVAVIANQGIYSNVTMDIRRQYAPLPADTRAILRQKTLLGEAYVELSTGSHDGPKLRDGATIPPQQVESTQALDQVLSSFDKPTQRYLQALLEGSYSALEGRGEDLNNAIGNLDPAVTELSALAGTLDQQQGAVQRLVNGVGTVTSALGQRAGDVQSIVRAGDSVLSATSGRDRQLAATVAAIPPFLAQLRVTLRDLDATLGLAAPSLHALRPVAHLLPPALTDTVALSSSAIPLLRETPRLLNLAMAALPSIERFVTALRPVARTLLPAVREVAPMMSFGGYYSREILAAMANLAAVNQGSAVASTTAAVGGVPAGVAHYVRVLAPFNDQSIFGQSIREPDNRHNAYASPGEMANLPDGLLSADCKNLGNPRELPLPPTPNVPCRLQPAYPWGRSIAPTTPVSYFPRLARAPR